MARFIKADETSTTRTYIDAEKVVEFYFDSFHRCTHVRFIGDSGFHQYEGDLTDELLGVSEDD